MLEIKSLVKRYGHKTAVDHLDLTCENGEIFGFIGPNGAGKTTTIKAVVGILDFDEGEIPDRRAFDSSGTVNMHAKPGLHSG